MWDGPQAGNGGGLAKASTSAFPIPHWERAHTNRGHSCFLLRRERDGEVGTEVKSILPKLEIGLGRGQSLRSWRCREPRGRSRKCAKAVCDVGVRMFGEP